MSWMLSCIGCGGKKLVDREEAKVLDFQHYSLTSVPPYVFECERFLEELYLDFNQISELPRELFLCNELLILSLSDNDLHSLPPAISSLSNLTSLDLSKNGISDIPDNIKSCKRLRNVNASTNPLCRLPEGFTQLVALKELSLSDTFLEYLPANFGRLTGLEVLELRENQLNTLPRSFTRLTALKKLDLGQNEFTEMPEVVGHLTSLTDLFIDNNRVKRIPAEIGKLTHLTFLDASKNRISEIDESIGNCVNLTHLYLTRNELEELPDSICQCTKFSVLHVDDNHLDHLPDDIGRLDRLIELKVSQNEISFLPSSVGLLRSLQFLHVDDNLLGTLPSELGSCARLIVITAAHNNIAELPAEMGSLGGLRVLNLCGNSLQNLPVSFTKLQLTALWLSENQAKPLVPLQCTNDSGQKVLTCFMLPQSETQTSPTPDRVEDEKPITEAEIEARRARSMIHFATDGELKSSGRLTRVPTPYPKELRALAKHTKNILALKKEKEKGVTAVPSEDKPAKKDKEKENSDSLVTMKSAAASVKVASNVASECAIKPTVPIRDEVPEKSVTTSPPEIKSNVVNPVRSSNPPVPLCQNGVSTVVPTTKPSSLAGNFTSFQKEKEIQPVKSNFQETSFVQASSVKTSISSSMFTSTNYTTSLSKGGQYQQEIKNTTATSPLPHLPSLRPASIAVPEPNSTPDRFNYPARPGSLALESVMPPWQNKRPGSLAAPINTVGIPMASPTQRSSSQNMLYEDGRSPSFLGDSWKPYQSPSQTPTKKDLYSRVLPATHEETVNEKSKEDVDDIEQSLQETAEDVTDQIASVTSLNEANRARNVHDEQKEPMSNAGLVSTINRVTEEGSDEDRSSEPVSSDLDKEKVTSKIPKIPIFSPSKPLLSPEEMSTESSVTFGIPAPSKVILSPIGTPSSKIPHFSTPKIAQITSPKVLSSEGVASKDFVSSSAVSGIQAPTVSYGASISKISQDKVKSSIPTLASPVTKEVDFDNKFQEEERHASRIPHKLEHPKKTSREVTPPSRDIVSPKGSTRIPTFGTPTYQPEIKSPITPVNSRSSYQSEVKSPATLVYARSPSQTEPKTPTAPGFVRSPSQTEPKTPTAPGFVRSPSQTEHKTPTSFGFTRLPNQTEAKTPVSTGFVRSPSTDKESSIPTKRGDSIPKPKPVLLSPVEKPINQTGIPILSPNDSSTDRNTRIPTTSNSSLRGRKSGVPVLADKNPKSSGRRLANSSS